MSEQQHIDRITALLTILVAICATTSGAAGYLSASANGRAGGYSTDSMKTLNMATTEYLQALQELLHDNDLNGQAKFLEYQNQSELAIIVRQEMFSVEMGYILANGSGAARYNYSYQDAWDAFTEIELSTSEDTYNRSLELSILSSKESGDAEAYLLVTVFMAVGALMGTAALSARSDGAKKALIVMILCILVGAIAYAVYSALVA
jgi:outer membrane usher protein FimD/PapC